MHVHYMEGRQPHGWHKENKRITWSQGNFNGRGMPELAEATERALRLDLCMIFFSFAYLSFSVQFSCYFVQYVMLHRPAGSAGRVLLRGM